MNDTTPVSTVWHDGAVEGEHVVDLRENQPATCVRCGEPVAITGRNGPLCIAHAIEDLYQRLELGADAARF